MRLAAVWLAVGVAAWHVVRGLPGSLALRPAKVPARPPARPSRPR